jgi:hypothetical protein
MLATYRPVEHIVSILPEGRLTSASMGSTSPRLLVIGQLADNHALLPT